MISISHIVKRYGQHTVLDGISLDIAQREAVAIIGPSGSGKSTLLRCLNLLERPASGTIRIGDTVLDTASCTSSQVFALRRRSAMVFQNHNLFNNKSALGNVAEPMITVQKVPKAEAYARAEALLARVGLLSQAQQYPVTLSGGQQQRVSIARALAVNADVILFDEPTSALDPERVHEVLHVIQTLAREQNTTMVIVTHEMAFARQVADRVIFMEEGKIVEQGNAKQVIDAPRQPATQRFLRRLSPVID
ncbi:amino acid ABC transporter ATP-binding protein [Zymobacter sp. IVIA_12111.31 C1]|uniref:amino acid ABC transporter ATP-binding protein n=1 Tax=Zymobacter sp. IVIA_12111.31 C1 TaxID=3394854 RepID=UPI0039C3AE18